MTMQLTARRSGLAALLAIAAIASLGPALAVQPVPVHAAQARAMVKVAMVGKLGDILVDAKGLTLYKWNQEKKGTIKCTGACARTWPPLLVPKGKKVSSHVTGAMGMLGTIKRPDGKSQVTYAGHALYYYQGDKKPGDAKCQAMEGWYVVSAHSM